MVLMKKIRAEGKSFTELVLTYILDRGEISDKKTFFKLIKAELSNETGEKIMTIAEQLRTEGIQQGIQQGIEKGRQEAKQETIRHLQLAGIDKIEIAKLLNLSIDEVTQLAQ
jgi:predicted transposase/invertase (TIGR01784 family)